MVGRVTLRHFGIRLGDADDVEVSTGEGITQEAGGVAVGEALNADAQFGGLCQ